MGASLGGGARDGGRLSGGRVLALVKSEEGLACRLRGSPCPPSIDFRAEATGLTSQLIVGETDLFLWLLMSVPVRGVRPPDHPKWNSSPVLSLAV